MKWTTTRLLFFCLLFAASSATGLMAQSTMKDCPIAFDEIDAFDSLHLVGSKPVALGYMIASQYETASGPKYVEEGEIMAVYTENDSISGFFLHIFLPEYDLQPIKSGVNVKLLLADTTIIGLYNFPDEGTFDRDINMRVYQHTCALPLDYYYRVCRLGIVQIRIDYERQQRTITLSPEQQLALMRALQCVGNRVNLYPIKA